jgi:hypothetical protein
MLVGDVKPLRVAGSRLPAMLSAGRPVVGTVIASKDFQVSAAYLSRARLSGSWCRPLDAGDAAGAVGTAAVVAMRAMAAVTAARTGVRRTRMRTPPRWRGGCVTT